MSIVSEDPDSGEKNRDVTNELVVPTPMHIVNVDTDFLQNPDNTNITEALLLASRENEGLYARTLEDLFSYARTGELILAIDPTNNELIGSVAALEKVPFGEMQVLCDEFLGPDNYMSRFFDQMNTIMEGEIVLAERGLSYVNPRYFPGRYLQPVSVYDKGNITEDNSDEPSNKGVSTFLRQKLQERLEGKYPGASIQLITVMNDSSGTKPYFTKRTRITEGRVGSIEMPIGTNDTLLHVDLQTPRMANFMKLFFNGHSSDENTALFHRTVQTIAAMLALIPVSGREPSEMVDGTALERVYRQFGFSLDDAQIRLGRPYRSETYPIENFSTTVGFTDISILEAAVSAILKTCGVRYNLNPRSLSADSMNRILRAYDVQLSALEKSMQLLFEPKQFN